MQKIARHGRAQQKRGERTALWTGRQMLHAILHTNFALTLTHNHCHSRSNAFKIKDPKSKPIMARVRGYIKEWTKHDAQFDLRYGIFTIEPTSVFLAINSGQQNYSKLVIKKDGSQEACAGVIPSAMLLEFLAAHPDIVELLDKNTIIRDVSNAIVEIHLPTIWAEPIPGPM